MAIPPHTTHWLQPPDKSVFGPLSSAYNREASIHMAASPTHTINHRSWPALFRKAWEKALSYGNIISSFRKCGVYPVNSLAIPNEAYAPSEPQISQAEISVALDVIQERPIGSSVITAEEMFQLIQSGATLTPLGPSTPEETPQPALPEPTTSYMAAIQEEFNLQIKETSQSTSTTSRKKITSHRILTSSEIIEEKRIMQEENERKEKEKEDWLIEWGFYALSASKAIFRARTYNCNLFSPVMMIT